MTAPKWHSTTITGSDDGQVLAAVTYLPVAVDDVNNDPRFLGEPPQRTSIGGCSHCTCVWDGHWLDGELVSPRVFHRFDRVCEGGYYADEVSERAR